MKKSVLIIAAAFVFGVVNLYAQNENANSNAFSGASNGDTDNASHEVSLTIPEVTLLDIEDGNGGIASGFTFEITPADLVSEAGEAFNSTIDLTDDANVAYLQYTALVASNKTVKAEITSGTLPSGFELKVQAAAVTANTVAGSIGVSAGMTTLPSDGDDGAGVAIVNSIGTSYTGTGSTNGHKLNYQLAIDPQADVSSLTSGSANITVTYTITD